jgi:hypothetical protein
MSNVIGSLLIEIKAKTDAFERGMKSAKDVSFNSASEIVGSLENIGKSLTKLHFGNLDQVGKSLGILSGIAVGTSVAVATSLLVVAERTSKNMVEMGHSAEKAAMDIKSFGENAYAAKRSGVPIEEFTNAMAKLAKTALSAAEGNVQAQRALQLAGTSATDAGGRLRTTGSILDDVIKKYETTTDRTLKAGLAQQLFGRGGAAIIPFLEKGSAAIAELRQEADRLGVAFDENALESAKRFRGELAQMKAAGEGAAIQFTAGLLPAINQVLSGLTHVEGHSSAMRSFGENIGAGFKIAAGWAETFGFLVTRAEIMWEKFALKMQSMATMPELAGIGKLIFPNPDNRTEGDLEAEIRELEIRHQAFQERLSKAAAVGNVGGGESGLGTIVPDFSKVGDLNKLIDELQRLGHATESLLAKEDGDKYAQQIANIRDQLNKIANFQAEHPEAIWVMLNEQATALGKAIDQIGEKQKAAFGAAMQQGMRESIQGLLNIPAPAVAVSGQTQAAAAFLRYQQDVNAQNSDALSIYNETRTAGERWQEQLTKLNFQLKQGVISQDEYDRALQTAKDGFSANFDIVSRYEQELRKLDDALKNELLTESARNNMLRERQQLEREKQAAQGGPGAGVRAGAGAVGMEWRGIGTETANTTRSIFGGMQSSMSNFFSSAVMGTKTVGRAFAQMGVDILGSVVGSLGQMLAKWITTHIAMLVVKQTTNQAGVASDAVAEAQSSGIGIAGSMKRIGRSAAEAAAHAFKWVMAEVPFPVNVVLAPAAAAAAFLGVMAFGALASAAGGMEVDRDQLVQVHKNEKILPARISQGFDRIINSQAGAANQRMEAARMAGSATMPHITNHFTINEATDANEVAEKVSTLAVARMLRKMRTAGVSR